MVRTVKFLIEYALLRAFIFFFQLFPYRLGQILAGKVLGGIAFHLGGSPRRRVTENLKYAFPEKSEEEKAKITRTSFKFLGQLVFEFVHFLRVRKKWVDKYVEIEPRTLELLRKAQDEKKGIILVAAHFGSWEILNPALISALKLDFHVYAAPQSNPYAGRYVFRMREKTGMKNILPTTSGHRTIKLLRKGATIGLVADQNARRNGIFIPFLNRPASIFQGPGIFAYHSGSPAFFIVGVRLPEGRFRIEAVPLGVIDKEKEPDIDKAVIRFTLRWIDLLEKYVKRYPDQYFWFHNRWKTIPREDDIIHERIPTDLEPLDT